MPSSAINHKKSKVLSSTHSHEPKLKAIFWGVRGTLPTPGYKTLKYGGNTSCVEIIAESSESQISLIMDAGSGISNYGDYAVANGKRDFHIFLSHVHYDHIIGLTRFLPLFRKDCKVTFYGMGNCEKSINEILQRFFSHPYFPVEYEALGANSHLSFFTIRPGNILELGAAKISFLQLNHPQGATACRIDVGNKRQSIVYATDHEHGTSIDNELINFARDASLLIMDSTYHNSNYNKFKGFGHSTVQASAQIAAQANVQNFGIFHHEPSMGDEDLENIILPEAKQAFHDSFLCTEGQTIDLDTFKAPEIPHPNKKRS